MFQKWDEYCERVGFGLFAEPLNAVSNVSFLVAAYTSWLLARRTGTLSTGVKILIALTTTVGLGSMLWHTLANSWTLYLDVVPIVFYIIGFIWLYTRKVMGQSVGFAGLSIGAFIGSAALVRPIGEALHGAPSYLPGLLVVLVIGMYHAAHNMPARWMPLIAAGVYFTALFFRTIDQELCHYMTFGTHWIWHTLIGLVLYLATRTLILSLAPSAGDRESTKTAALA